MINPFFNYLLIPFLNWGYYAIGLAVVFAVAGRKFGRSRFLSRISYKALIWLALAFKVLYASLETFGQYYVWAGGIFTKFFLDQRVADLGVLKEFSGKLFWIFNNRFGYLIFYSWGRFWMSVFVSLVVAAVFFMFLKVLKKYKERFFEEGEVELGFLLALVVGWPNFIVFLFAAFLSVVLVSVIRIIFFKEFYTTLGMPFLIAAFISVFFGAYFINLFNLLALRA